MNNQKDMFIGMTNLEAFATCFREMCELTHFIHKHRGSMPVDDLIDQIMWRLENITGIEPNDT